MSVVWRVSRQSTRRLLMSLRYCLGAVLLVVFATVPDAFAQRYSGISSDTNVSIPRLEAEFAVIDGAMTDEVWSRAARLADFSQYQPVDGRPAADPTEVYVWYSAEAIFFGVKATELHGDVVRATQANRDNIASEDHVQILLDTQNDNQIGYLFGVNPLGVQQDGTRSDQFGGGAGGRSATGGGSSNINPLDRLNTLRTILTKRPGHSSPCLPVK